ncbi:MAG: cation:proton antiporter [Gammaproteobacteria bacterium]|nr:cation:proton antiporter [Gammaproteobacteria bacterium]
MGRYPVECAFASLCWLAARYVEHPLTRLAARLKNPPERMLPVAGAGFVIAAIAGTLGFSLAIGALFAGLVFSRDPAAIRVEARFDDLYAFFAPFFFIGIGLQTAPDALAAGAAIGLWLLAAAVAGKVVGAILPALLVTDVGGAALIAASMIPRAEIAMVIAHQGREAGLLPDAMHAALVMVTAGTCLLAPWLIHSLLARWPQKASSPHS